MPSVKLIADSGATKTEWSLVRNGKTKTILTQGISPYFLNTTQIKELLINELQPKLKEVQVDEVYYYGTGCSNPANNKIVRDAIKKLFPVAKIDIQSDLLAAAKALCGDEKGIASILGTGSNSCYYNGKRIAHNNPGLGYVLGDEGSGAYLGKKVLQYFLYDTFDEELRGRFNVTYTTDATDILENIYKKPLPNRYMASFTKFLVENRGHYMVENIIEDGLNDFFFTHLCKYKEVWKLPVHFVGSVAFGFKDVIQSLCNTYEFELGRVIKKPMSGLVEYHR